jgi:hypothetical protein
MSVVIILAIFFGHLETGEKGYFWPMKRINEKSANWVILAPEIKSRFSGCLVQEVAKGRVP